MVSICDKLLPGYLKGKVFCEKNYSGCYGNFTNFFS